MLNACIFKNQQEIKKHFQVRPGSQSIIFVQALLSISKPLRAKAFKASENGVRMHSGHKIR